MPDVMHFIKMSAPLERVYDAITTQDGVRNWWTRDATLDPNVGGAGEFAFYDRRVVSKIRIEALDPPVHVAWRTLDSAAPGRWNGTTMTFDLRQDGNDTGLLFAHRGFPEADEAFARVTTGWAYYLMSLQKYVETGTGAPHPDVDFHRMVR